MHRPSRKQSEKTGLVSVWIHVSLWGFFSCLICGKIHMTKCTVLPLLWYTVELLGFVLLGRDHLLYCKALFILKNSYLHPFMPHLIQCSRGLEHFTIGPVCPWSLASNKDISSPPVAQLWESILLSMIPHTLQGWCFSPVLRKHWKGFSL